MKRSALFGFVLVVLVAGAAQTWWSGRSQRQFGAEVASLAGPGSIRLIASETCAVCLWARAWMLEHKVAFTECLIETDAACRAEYEALRAPGTPVMVVNGRPQLGFNPMRLREGLSLRS